MAAVMKVMRISVHDEIMMKLSDGKDCDDDGNDDGGVDGRDYDDHVEDYEVAMA